MLIDMTRQVLFENKRKRPQFAAPVGGVLLSGEVSRA